MRNWADLLDEMSRLADQLADETALYAQEAALRRTHYGHDAQALRQDLERTNAHAMNWERLVEKAAILPELEASGLSLLEQQLGYLPPEAARVVHEPFLRALLCSRQAGNLSDAVFAEQVNQTVQLIRNEDVDLLQREYPLSRLAAGEVQWPERRRAALVRLTSLLGYVPVRSCSVVGEGWLCDVLPLNIQDWPTVETAMDCRALTFVTYQEVLRAHGPAAAEQSPVLAWRLVPSYSAQK